MTTGIINGLGTFFDEAGYAFRQAGADFQELGRQSYATDMLRFHINHPCWWGCGCGLGWGWNAPLFAPHVSLFEPIYTPTVYTYTETPPAKPFHIKINSGETSIADAIGFMNSLGNDLHVPEPQKEAWNIGINNNSSVLDGIEVMNSLGNGLHIPEPQKESWNIGINNNSSISDGIEIMDKVGKDLKVPEPQKESWNIGINNDSSILDALNVIDGLGKDLGTSQNGYTTSFGGAQPAQKLVRFNPNGTAEDAARYIESVLGGTSSAQPSTQPSQAYPTEQPRQTVGRLCTTDMAWTVTTPLWYTEICDKMDDPNGKPTSREKALKELFDTMGQKYNPYYKDQNGQYLYDRNNIKKLNSFGNKIYSLMIKMQSKDRIGITNMIDGLSSEELAAIEFQFNVLTYEYATITDNKTFREMLKDASLATGLESTKVNTDACIKWFNKLDAAAIKTSNPRCIAASFYQALTNHTVGDVKIDTDRVTKLLKSLVGKPELTKAVLEEYTTLGKDRGKANDLGSILSTSWGSTEAQKALLQKLELSANKSTNK